MVKFNIIDQYPIRLGITDRLGGISQGPYGCMNTNFYHPDQFQTACSDIKIAIDSLGITAKIIVATRQTHSSNLLIIDENFEFKGLKAYDVSNTDLKGYELYSVDGTDGLITNRNDIVLMTFYADCVPLFIYDTEKKVVASVHSGWRGTSKRIGEVAIKMLEKQYESNAESLIAGIGQSAGKCCYEVDEPVVEIFKSAFKPEQVSLLFEERGGGKYLVDLKKANQMIFNENGLLEGSVEVKSACTICEPTRYHSHRYVNGGPRGSMSMFVQLI